MNIIKNISVLGDSILKGVIIDELSGKYKFLKESAASLFSKTNNVKVINHSKFGCTTEKALRNLPAVLEKAVSSDIILLELGGNDCDFNWEEVCKNPAAEHKPHVMFEDFKRNIALIIEKILDAKKRPVIMTLPPIDSEKYFNWITGNCREKAKRLLSFMGEKSLIYRHQELYASALEKMAFKYNLYIVNVREALLSIPMYSGYLCLDGIHLNEKGQNFIKQVFDSAYRKYTLGLS
ncbi:MAG: SGNH/GDSL hydrolase family protein [Elusimicrobiota bacterium]|jgi:lysophospholipase L1-like esterase|nr:SGNH/GDSL hydrolase family protein [Elusimicrobiota bacterium]